MDMEEEKEGSSIAMVVVDMMPTVLEIKWRKRWFFYGVVSVTAKIMVMATMSRVYGDNEGEGDEMW